MSLLQRNVRLTETGLASSEAALVTAKSCLEQIASLSIKMTFRLLQFL